MKSILALSVFLSAASFASSLEMNLRYTNALDGKLIEKKQELGLKDEDLYVSDNGILKSILTSKMGTLFADTLVKAEALCKSPVPRGCRTNTRCLPPPPVVENNNCKEASKALAKELVEKLNTVNTQIITSDFDKTELMEFVLLGHKLAKNIEERKQAPPIRPTYIGRPGGIPSTTGVANYSPSARGAGALSVTAGGAQGVDHFIKMINDGYVPDKGSFTSEGFMSHFDFPLINTPECKELLCVNPVYKLDKKDKKLFVQVALGTELTEATFKRKTLNLSVVLDISGSMSADDGTEIERIEWAKKALLKTVEKMDKEDTLSIVLFNSESKVLLEPVKVKDAGSIKELINKIIAEGSTNVEAGLRDGYNLVSKNFQKNAENRVILISDAGLNTGATSEAELIRLVSDFAGEEIGLTAIGLGLNFNEKFIHGITLGKGSNYLFVNSGKGLDNYFKQFDFLVSPIAYNFKAELKINGLDAKLIKAHGVPMKADSKVQELLDIRTLFLASEGGGTILLEYDLK